MKTIAKEMMEELVEEELNSMFYDGEKYYYLTEELLKMHIEYLKEPKNNVKKKGYFRNIFFNLDNHYVKICKAVYFQIYYAIILEKGHLCN